MRSVVVAFCMILLAFCALTSQAQTQFRSAIFLHHSTGGDIWGPNGSPTSVPAEVTAYNTAHGLNGANAFTFTETWWPGSTDNEWSTWHEIFENRNSSEDIRNTLTSYPVVMIKSCFPSANIGSVGGPSDSLSPTTKSLWNYKWHWRSILAVMRTHPENFFVIWTNAPQVGNNTSDAEAQLSAKFARWAKDTLAAGHDPLVGAFPRNVYVFDFFGKLAGADGRLPLSYAASGGDSHPNASATALVAPQLVHEVLDAALAYELFLTGVPEQSGSPRGMALRQNYPNPFNPVTTIEVEIDAAQAASGSRVTLTVMDLLGREVATLMDGTYAAGRHAVRFDASRLSSGIYLYRLSAGRHALVRMMTVMR